jgi:hypothetical protein
VVVIIVVMLVLIAMWHFIYGQQQKLAPAEGEVGAPGVEGGAIGEDVNEGDVDEEEDEEETESEAEPGDD